MGQQLRLGARALWRKRERDLRLDAVADARFRPQKMRASQLTIERGPLLSKTNAGVATVLLRTVLHLAISERPVLLRDFDQIDDHVLLA